MRLATLSIETEITKEAFATLVGTPTAKLFIDFHSREDGKVSSFDILPIARNAFADPSSQDAVLFSAMNLILNLADFELNNTDVKFKIDDSIANRFKLSAKTLVNYLGLPTSTINVPAHTVELVVATRDANINTPIDVLTKVIDISSNIVQGDKDEFTAKGLTLTGTTWADFTVVGNSKIEFRKVEPTTVFVGNKENGFVTTI